MTLTEQSFDPWDIRAADWAELQEPAWRPLFATALQLAGVTPGMHLLDIGCGAGVALQLANEMGAVVTGLNRSVALVRFARERVPQGRIVTGDMEHLPFADQSFDLVTGINAFQFAGHLPDALAEARRVCRPGGSVFILVWGARENCELQRISLAPVLSLLPPSTGSTPPQLDRDRIETAMRQAWLRPTGHGEIAAGLTFPDAETAIRAFLSAGVMQRILAHAGEAIVRKTLAATLPAVTGTDGKVTWNNQFIWVKAEPVSADRANG
jgi:ubiquinone/menaquinone biosynthesis C-methylase UbiE